MAVGMATESLRWHRLLAFGLLVLVGWFGVEQIASSRYILFSCEIWLDLGFNGFLDPVEVMDSKPGNSFL